MNYVGDVGVRIEFETNIDISEIEEAKIIVLKPDLSKEEWICNKDENIYYVTKEGDFNIAGIYKLQLFVKTPTFAGRGNILEIEVKEGI